MKYDKPGDTFTTTAGIGAGSSTGLVIDGAAGQGTDIHGRLGLARTKPGAGEPQTLVLYTSMCFVSGAVEIYIVSCTRTKCNKCLYYTECRHAC